MAVVVAYDMYKECLLEARAQDFIKFDEEDKKRAKKQSLSFYGFRQRLSLQALSYAPENQYYPGDKNFRVVTQIPKSDEKRGSGREMEATMPCRPLRLKQSPKNSSRKGRRNKKLPTQDFVVT